MCDVGRVAVKHCFKLLSFLHLLSPKTEFSSPEISAALKLFIFKYAYFITKRFSFLSILHISMWADDNKFVA